MRELLLEIWTSIRRNKLRTFLTGFSVAWGIFMLVILLGSGNGLKNGVTSNFGDYATNSIDLFGGHTSKPYMGYQKGRRIRMWNSDLEILEREFPEIDQVAANSWFNNHTATYGNEYTKVWLRGSLPKVATIEGVKIIKGRFVNDADIKEYRKSIVIDESMQSLLFKGADPLGAKLKIDSTMFTVVGVYKGDAQRSSSSCYIPLTTGQLLYKANNPEVNNAIITVVGIDTDDAMRDFEKRIVQRLAAEHHFDPTDESAIWIDNNMERYKNFMVVFAGINIFVWIIGLGTLLAGIVGVSNIMLVTVTERTFEFGIRKALGAKPVSIIRLILTESVMITAIFGYIGMVLGVTVMEVVNYMLNSMPETVSSGPAPSIFLNPTLDLGVAVSATVVLVIAGLIAGYVPAYRAAQLKTIDALRHNK
ncbi:ABC transporter permease [uncultured Alistipes sp.]|jgi:ABC-type antimicrobial peptide transport system, permease component|uniref:ABC transporter permease n=1 Tax=uncultured Alistipes sp. TaxID=538949 RepID=UPI0025E2A22E|nr:ABC transporter permease [uncultured Alistipes sp.]